MGKKIARVVLTVLGAGLGPAIIVAASSLFKSIGYMGIEDVFMVWAVLLIYAASAAVTAIILYLISPALIGLFVRMVHYLESRMADMSLSDIFFGVIGLIVGLVIAYLASTLTDKLESKWLAFGINAVLYITFPSLGWKVVTKRKGEINVPNWFKRRDKGLRGSTLARPKVLDTSVIIDGRIADICKTGIIEGIIVVPNFVLQELRHIADSADAMKRNRGRRGLDILNHMQSELELPIKVNETDYEEIAEVDAKLIKLAYDIGGVVVTNDYNLNKVAGVQRVPVLNINDLANAIKPVVIPGEEMQCMVMKEGKEAGQGVAYLDDGTMIVIDSARRFVGENVTVTVTSVLQTSAGRMIFAKLKNNK